MRSMPVGRDTGEGQAGTVTDWTGEVVVGGVTGGTVDTSPESVTESGGGRPGVVADESGAAGR